jgi:hypothetical protein
MYSYCSFTKDIYNLGYISRFSSHSSASRGVAVLFKNSFEFHINQEIIDECGNFIILDINIQDYRKVINYK